MTWSIPPPVSALAETALVGGGAGSDGLLALLVVVVVGH